MRAGYRRSAGLADAAVLAALMLAVRLTGLDHAPHYDEMFHVLAARSLLSDGTLCIPGCLLPYDRAAGFTVLIAGALAAAGDTLPVARLPSVLAGTAWVVAVFWTMRSIAGRGAAWAGALLIGLDAAAVYLSQLARFYALHGLLVWVGAWALYLAVRPAPAGRRLVLVAVAGLAWVAALHLQVTTLIAALPVGLWLAATGAYDMWRAPGATRRSRAFLVAGVIAGVAAALLILVSGVADQLWADYRASNLVTAPHRDNVRFYHEWLQGQYGALYVLLPLAALLALARRPRPAGFCLTVFVVAIGLHSFAGAKSYRYAYYAVPFLLAVWAMALAEAVPALTSRLAAAVPVRRGLVQAAVAVALAWAGWNTNAFNTTAVMIRSSDAEWPASKPPYRGHADWERAARLLRPVADSVEVVVTSASTKGIFFLGRSDVELNANQLYLGTTTAPEFTADWRTGKPVVSAASSIAELMQCEATGLLVVERDHWKRRSAVTDTTAEYVETHMDPVPLPASLRLLAFRWKALGAVRPCPATRRPALRRGGHRDKRISSRSTARARNPVRPRFPGAGRSTATHPQPRPV